MGMAWDTHRDALVRLYSAMHVPWDAFMAVKALMETHGKATKAFKVR